MVLLVYLALSLLELSVLLTLIWGDLLQEPFGGQGLSTASPSSWPVWRFVVACCQLRPVGVLA